MSSDTTHIKDLYVADFRDASHTPESQKWKVRNLSNKVFRAEACARQIWVGSKERFADFPELEYDPRNQMFEGEEGYAQLLRYVLGLVNEGEYDPAAEKRFFDGWSAINRTCPQYAAPYNMIVANIVADAEMIKKNVFSQMLPDRPWMIARDIAGHKRGSTALVIGEMDKKAEGRASALTERMSGTLYGRGVNAVDRVLISHPDEETRNVLNKSIFDMFDKKDIILIPEPVDFYSRLPELVERADQVYVTMDCNENPSDYAYLMTCWMKRSRSDNTLVDLKNDLNDAKHHMSLSSKAIRNGGVYWADTVQDEKDLRIKHNQVVMHNVYEAIDLCAQMRAQDQKPNAHSFDNLSPE